MIQETTVTMIDSVFLKVNVKPLKSYIFSFNERVQTNKQQKDDS